jgi:tetratricopeptide (TPR) repeat protein
MVSTSQAKKSQRQNELAGTCLVLVTLALFLPAMTFDRIQFDDGIYVFDNPHVSAGVTLAGVKWAFTKIYIGNWHPLTWISHMLDCAIFGSFPGGHHLTNVLLHTANTLLLFLLLQRVTKLTGPSFIVAGLFGWHPAHVESVAWIAERKDVLSTLFFLLTLIAYARYAAEPQKIGRRKFYYALSLVLFALGLMSKQMLVTLPFVLLLLDCWPLKRIAGFSRQVAEPGTGEPVYSELPLRKILLEKIPYFALTCAACAATLLAQGTGAIRTTADVPLGLRALNALIAYAKYLGEAFWPTNLSIYYLLPSEAGKVPAILAALLLVAVSYAAFRMRSQMPWLPLGWLWFLGTLVPVIGLVQVGSQAMADRYTYIPYIGLFIAVVWSMNWFAERNGVSPTVRAGFAALVLVGCVFLTHRQLGFWHDDVSLFSHAVDATPNSYFAEYELGAALEKADRMDEAVKHYSASVQLNPLYEPAHFRAGMVLMEMGKLDDAALHFSEAMKRDPNSEQLHNALGVVFAQQGKSDAAISEFNKAMQSNPDYSSAYLNCGNELEKIGRPAEALTNYYRAHALEPDSTDVLKKLALLLATCPDAKIRNPPAALQFAQRASDLSQNQNPACLATLATATAATGNFSKAIAIAEDARNRANDLHLTNQVSKLERDLASYRQNRVPGTTAAP